MRPGRSKHPLPRPGRTNTVTETLRDPTETRKEDRQRAAGRGHQRMGYRTSSATTIAAGLVPIEIGIALNAIEALS